MQTGSSCALSVESCDPDDAPGLMSPNPRRSVNANDGHAPRTQRSSPLGSQACNSAGTADVTSSCGPWLMEGLCKFSNGREAIFTSMSPDDWCTRTAVADWNLASPYCSKKTGFCVAGLAMLLKAKRRVDPPKHSILRRT